jgi:SAM-dependent methyltransferase
MLHFLTRLFRRTRTLGRGGLESTNEPRPASGEIEGDGLSWLEPPGDIHDVPAWDHYWREQAAHGLSPAMFDLFARDQDLVDEMLKRGLSTVLCAGSGISQEPRALAYAGMAVTAMDTSPVAMELARTFPATDEYLQQFFERPQRQSGGSVDFVVGDIRDPEVCSGPFHVVIERCTVQLFPEQERSAVLQALVARLDSGGIILSHHHSGSWRPGEPLVHAAEPWFVKQRFTICDVTGRTTQEWPGVGDDRSVWLFTSTG